ncbi:MAG TPA: Hsp20/alpha crystallin family protein [Candidatus Omnitrophota bacterium]|nr:Hsp20/alpha crystallin family protein [Candidatus Omnitrophota bacterium]HPS37432.1 Hsp20/alpha crystallin family protein [Candidatus Omnitrophota bacterium]
MTESDTPQKKIQASHVIIALLILVVLLQTAVLLHQNRRQASLERQQRKETYEAVLPRPPFRGHALAANRATPQPVAANPAASFFEEDPFEEFDAVSRRISNMMRSAMMFSAPALQSMRQAMNQDLGSAFSPSVDLEETEKSYIVRSDLPGLEKDKINLTVRDNALTIEGMRETSQETQDTSSGFYAHERSYGSFSRTVPLPGPVDESKIAAEYKNGVLTITLPKIKGQTNVQKVPIQ